MYIHSYADLYAPNAEPKDAHRLLRAFVRRLSQRPARSSSIILCYYVCVYVYYPVSLSMYIYIYTYVSMCTV